MEQAWSRAEQGSIRPEQASIRPGGASRSGDELEQLPAQDRLRRDEVLLIALGVIPGAAAGGRLAYGLIHSDYYRAVPNAFLDPGTGSLSLSGAVAGGIVTGAVVAHLLGPSVGRWMRVAAGPMLLGLALGKAAMILGGEGQGVPSGGPYAVRFDPRVAWPDPSIALVPAEPAQLYEAGAVALVLLIVLLLGATRVGRSGGVLFGIAVLLWCLVRCLVAFSWRDPVLAGSLRAEQLVCLAIGFLAALGTLAAALRRWRRRAGVEREFA